ncbi:Purple acid phosphatase 23 isoform C [Glycine soja]|uniref:Purple acid phosphatase 23 isoform B n=1 Tax=Glycine soja TaxID=3848 RepID=A0A445HBX7_GLYSO|nr:Purple acid phosphatase 23 isoform B [Glycine soja]RZB71101.1 Purple acid phosphatase 23 isoform C [Glycine soja]
MKICTTFFMPLAMVLVMMAVAESHIPTTLDGPFDPVTHRFDPSLRQDSEDLPVTHPRLRKNVTSNFAEQIALAISSPTSMWVSWVTGALSTLRISKKFCFLRIGLNVTPIDSASVESEVWYGKESGKYISVRKGDSVVYSLLYPFEGLWNYTSGIIHHVKLKGLEPSTRYYYKCGDSSTPAMSREFIFETFPKPSPNNYPARIAVIGDLGLTSNSTSTIDHLKF